MATRCHFRHTAKIRCFVSGEPYDVAMNNPPALEERVTKLEYFVFEQLPPKMAAMDLAAAQIYGLTEANGEAITGLRVDMASLETHLHADMAAFKAALNLQGDSLRKEIGVTRTTLLSAMASFRQSVDRRFGDTDDQFAALRGELGTVKEDVGFLKSDFWFLKEEVGTVKEDVGTLKQEVGTFKTDVNQRFDGVDQRFDGVDQRFDGVDQRFDGVDQRFDTLENKIDMLIAEIRAGRN
jgi:archaellum component FlaC